MNGIVKALSLNRRLNEQKEAVVKEENDELTMHKLLNVLRKCVFVIVNEYLLFEHTSVDAH